MRISESATMPDMLVKLYRLPPLQPALVAAARNGYAVRRAVTSDKPATMAWVRTLFPSWCAEVEAAFARTPVTCYIALHGKTMTGFACYDATCLNFFGPTGVAEAERGRGLGRALLLAALHAQKAQGYAYAIIGGVGPAEYYVKAVGATLIEGSTPGIYAQRQPR
jgi:GNAT superfamily N-acetyltransferase